MLIYDFFKFLFKCLSLSIFLFIGFAVVFLMLKGADFSLTLGENWFLYHDKSLYLAEPFISRYLQPALNIFTDKDLWLDVIVPYLLQELTYIVLPITAGVSMGVYIICRALP